MNIIPLFLNQDYENKKILQYVYFGIDYLQRAAGKYSYNQTAGYHVCLHDNETLQKTCSDRMYYKQSVSRNSQKLHQITQMKKFRAETISYSMETGKEYYTWL